jgi:type II secretory pathway component PulF
MLKYKYTARDPANGEKIEGTIDADNEQFAAKLIQQQGYSPLKIELDEKKGFLGFGEKIKGKDKIIFSRQLATLINAGLPLVQSLNSVMNQTKNTAMKSVLATIISDVEGGKNFSVSLGQHPKVFNQIFVNLVAAGEVSGTLDRALERLASQQEKDEEILSKVRGAMIYPVIVLLVMSAVVTFMLVSVLPQVKSLYDGLPSANLPFITVGLLALSSFMVNYWWVMLLVIGVTIFATSRWASTGPGKKVIDGLKLRMWPIAPLFTRMYMARFARTSTTLVASGVPLLQVLDITSRSINNTLVEQSLNAATEKVKGGKALSVGLANDPNFLDLVPQMIKIGEDSGQLEQMLEKTADYYEKEVDDQIKAISTIIEPLLMVILGVVAITIVAAILLPIYGLVGTGI